MAISTVKCLLVVDGSVERDYAVVVVVVVFEIVVESKQRTMLRFSP